MVLDPHYAELLDKHRKLDHEIEAEMSRPFADSLKITKLKRQKLRLKDKMTKLESLDSRVA